MRRAASMLWPGPRDPDGPLTHLLVALTFLTGLVDATSYLALGHVFVANMTGNVVFLGFALAGARGVSAASSLIALGAFLCGARAGGRLAALHGAHRGRLLRAAGSGQALLIAIALLVALLAATPLGEGVRDILIALLALAMGVQNAAAQRLAVGELTTTVLTRTLTGLAADIGLTRAGIANSARRVVAVGAMLLGALAGGLLVLDVSIASALAVALFLVSGVALAVHVLSNSDAVWTRPSGGH